MRFSRRREAPYYLSLLSFVESFILPFPPPDVMLAPMSLARPSRAMRYAALTLLFSVLGGLVGYLIGAFLFDLAEPYIIAWGYEVASRRLPPGSSIGGSGRYWLLGFHRYPTRFSRLPPVY